jgi:hypothetical protein
MKEEIKNMTPMQREAELKRVRKEIEKTKKWTAKSQDSLTSSNNSNSDQRRGKGDDEDHKEKGSPS